MRRNENYYEIMAEIQTNVRSLFSRTNRGIEIDNSEIILIEGDATLHSLRNGLIALDRTRRKLRDVLEAIEPMTKIGNLDKGEISGGTIEDVDERFDYVKRLMKSIGDVINYLSIPQIMETGAFLAINELIHFVTSGHPAPPITITICDVYTI